MEIKTVLVDSTFFAWHGLFRQVFAQQTQISIPGQNGWLNSSPVLLFLKNDAADFGPFALRSIDGRAINVFTINNKKPGMSYPARLVRLAFPSL
jgi:hypothetical protein